MSDNLPKVAFEAFANKLQGLNCSISDELHATYAIGHWQSLTKDERDAWFNVVAAILDATTPRTC